VSILTFFSTVAKKYKEVSSDYPLPIQVTGSLTTIITYNDSNPLPGTGMGTWVPRDQTARTLYLPHLSESIQEQTIVLRNTTDATINATLKHTFNFDGTYTDGVTIWSGALLPDARVVLAPERSPGIVDTDILKSVEVPELRLPHDKFALTIQAQSLPTTGWFRLQSARKY
jgi:hypothetical protein